MGIFIWCRFIEINKKYGRVALVKLYFFYFGSSTMWYGSYVSDVYDLCNLIFNEKAGFFINSDSRTN